MKLLPQEQKSLFELLERLDIRNEFSLIKRKGWLHIESSQKSFAFHRKKESKLIDGNFEDSNRYFVREIDTVKEVNNWEEVLNLIETHFG